MRAVRLHGRGGPEELRYEEAPLPSLSEDDALVRVHALSITPSELHWSATYTSRDGTPRLPSIPGHDVSGVVERVGPRATATKVGDAVYGLTDFWRDGTAAEYVAVRADDLAPKPATLNHAQAATVPLSALTAWQGLFDHAALDRGQTVLVHGASGGVGTYAVQLARWCGARVIGTARAPDAGLLKDLGCDEVIDYSATRFEDQVAGLDVVLDTVGGDTLERSWRVLRRGGTLVTTAGNVNGENVPRYGVRAISFLVEPRRSQLVEIGRLIDAGILLPIQEATFSLQGMREAYERALRSHHHGKSALRVPAGGSNEATGGRPSKPPMRIAIVGAGVVGGYFGSRLAGAGEDVVFVERGKTLRAIEERGFEVDDVGRSFVVRPAQTASDPAMLGYVDAVLLAVKGWQVEGAVSTLRPLMGPETFAVPLMDGVDATEQLASAFDRRHVVGGLAVMLGSVIAPGHVRNRLRDPLVRLGELDGGVSERVVRLQQAFSRAGVHAEIVPDIVRARWEKLVQVGPWSALGAVTRAPLGVVLCLPETRALLGRAMREVVQVARACGVTLPDDAIERALRQLGRAPPTALGNLRDIVEGRPSELETEVGAVVRRARAVKVPAPVHEMLYAALLPQEQRARARAAPRAA
jgi:2-dehydropantoate 2-reductase